MATTHEIKLDSAITALLLCVFFGGWGTMIVGCMSKNEEQKKAAMMLGLIQLFVPFFSWYTGYTIYNNSK